ncbi:hypothetical protein PVNG_04165 [Plasmodium vivax North Korean]|uniref:Peptidase M14 domain-containing protein n=1 Tax=Plasmodium vivax North Korean TaxID=1035514 RepID=A0A0J9U1E1_PLAVI|nr:hypothetical protein PVNG_04165 [Plasmodium vivax North Korean]
MLFEDEDSSSRLHHFDYHRPGPVYLLRYLGVGGECGGRTGVCAEGCVEGSDKRERSEGELPFGVNDNGVVRDCPEGNEAKLKLRLPQGGGRNHVGISGRSGRSSSLEANQLELIFHKSVRAIYEGTNAQVEIPTIARGGWKGGSPCPLGEKNPARETHSDDVEPDKIHIQGMTNQGMTNKGMTNKGMTNKGMTNKGMTYRENVPHKIEDLKSFLMERQENVNERNRQLFMQTMSSIDETLQLNHLCLCRNGRELDPASFAWHDSFVGQALGRACPEGETFRGGQLPSSPPASSPNLYEKLKHIRCVEEPGHTYQHVYPPRCQADRPKEVQIPQGSIQFNAKFESSNLQCVLKEKNREVYSIFLKQDIRSNEKKNQWCYFSASYIPGSYYQSDYFEGRKKKKKEQSDINRIIKEGSNDAYLDSKEDLKVSLDSSDLFLISDVKKLEKPFSVLFRIENMSRPFFLYREGHSPLVFSECRSVKEEVLWERAAYNVTYTRNDTPRHYNLKTNAFEKLSYCTYTLEFAYDFIYPYDTVYFASSLPYTYSYLMKYLGLLKSHVSSEQEGQKRINYVQGTLCTTALGLACPVLAVTNYDGEAADEAAAEAGTADEAADEAAPDAAPNGESRLVGAENSGRNYAEPTDIEGSHRSKAPGEAGQPKELHPVGSVSVPVEEDPKLVDAAKERLHHCCEESTYIDDAMCMYNLCHHRRTGGRREGEDNPGQRSPRKCSNAFMRQFERLLERPPLHPLSHDGGRRPRGSSTSPSLSGSSKVVTSPTPAGEPPSQAPLEEKKIIFLTARVHPGETNASYVMHGFLAFITSDSAYADALRDNFIFIIIPMLNVDGVVLGHNRLCSNGFDLNRQWNRPIYYLHQTVHTAKALIKRIHRKGRVVFFCDFHGHSRKYNCFFFGNFDSRAQLRGRKLAELFCHVMGASLPWFSLEDTHFKSESVSRGTARNVCGGEFAIDCSYTFEVSLIGVKVRSAEAAPPEGGGQTDEANEARQTSEPRDGEELPTRAAQEQKWDFFFFDENVLMLTGISFGISLFKFFNFVSHHEGDISEGERQQGEHNNKKKMASVNESAEVPPSRVKAKGSRVQLGGQLACHRGNLNRLERKRRGEMVKKASLEGVLPLGRVVIEPSLDVKSDAVEPAADVKSHLDGGHPLEGGIRSKAYEAKGDAETTSSSPPGKSTSRQLRKDLRAVKGKGLPNRKKEAKARAKNGESTKIHDEEKTLGEIATK